MPALHALTKKMSLKKAKDNFTVFITNFLKEEANQLNRVIKKRLSTIVNKRALKGVCLNKKAAFLLSNLNNFKISHFYRIW